MTTTLPIYTITPSARLSPWQQFKNDLKTELLNIMKYNYIAQIFCCTSVQEVECLEQDMLVRNDIRESMRSQMGYTLDTGVSGIMESVVLEEQYNLGNLRLLAKANQGMVRTASQWRQYLSKVGVDPDTLRGIIKPARVIPRFAAAMALELRMNLGALSANGIAGPANILLAEREYLRLCRYSDVRAVDAVSHQQYTLNAFFGEDVLDVVSRSRGGCGPFLKWLVDTKVMDRSRPTIC